MRKSWIGLCVAVVTIASAHAQSKITLYGLIDEGVDYTSNVTGHSMWDVGSGYTQGADGA